MEVTDTHCHLDFNLFDDDRDEVLERAGNAGLIRILNPGIDLSTSRTAISLSEIYPEVFVAVGIHPNEALSYTQNTIKQLRSIAQHPKVIAIGEIGLDFYRDYAPIDLQKRIFREQLYLAAELSLPVVIHNREATNDILDILESWQSELNATESALAFRLGVLHSFSGDILDASRAVALGFKIGITGSVTFNNSRKLHEVVSGLHLDHMLIETDAPFLTPHPHRGQRNEPAHVLYIAQMIGRLKNEALDVVTNITTQNAVALFHW